MFGNNSNIQDNAHSQGKYNSNNNKINTSGLFNNSHSYVTNVTRDQNDEMER